MGLEDSGAVLPVEVTVILVVGPGRCGTSAVAGFLHKLGVYMTPEPGFLDESNPAGFYEDIEFVKLNHAFLNHEISLRRLITGVRVLILERKEPWGLKHPAVAELLSIYLPLLGDKVKFIRLYRDREDIVSSMMKQYGWDYQKAAYLTARRDTLLDYCLKDYSVLDVDFECLRDIDTLQRIADYVQLPMNDEAVAHIVTPEEIEQLRKKVVEIRADMKAVPA
jgi:hypothetical protein